jgi:hypothetical protein
VAPQLKAAIRLQIEIRRRAVARLTLRGYYLDEITRRIATEPNEETDAPLCNPKDGKPWSRYAIHRDQKANAEAWKQAAAADIATLRSQQLAETKELRRDAWEHGERDVALRTLQHEAKLTGTEKPTKNLNAPATWDPADGGADDFKPRALEEGA